MAIRPAERAMTECVSMRVAMDGGLNDGMCLTDIVSCMVYYVHDFHPARNDSHMVPRHSWNHCSSQRVTVARLCATTNRSSSDTVAGPDANA
jgi:hypothetical protein